MDNEPISKWVPIEVKLEDCIRGDIPPTVELANDSLRMIRYLSKKVHELRKRNKKLIADILKNDALNG